LFEKLGQDADLEWLMLDSTVIRAPQHAASAPKKKGGQKNRGLVARGAVSRPSSLPPPML
jgi:hypothetical protein